MSVFNITEHVIDGAHIREYARATAEDQNAPLKLHVKRYTPRDNPSPRNGDVTIIGGHGNGFPKELYEPLWHNLHQQLTTQGVRIRDIWIADCAWQGRSGILNQEQGVLGNDPGWYDYSRDIIHMINTFRMPRPLVAVGHSFGANALAHAALLHPRLFHSVVLLDAVIAHSSASSGAEVAAASTIRRDVWPSREAAAASFRKSPFYQSWDPRVLDLWIEHGLRVRASHSSSSADPDPQGENEVTLTTSKHQEVFTFLRPSWPAFDLEGKTVIHADWIKEMGPPQSFPTTLSLYPFYRPEPMLTYDRLANVRPGVLFINGASSTVATAQETETRAGLTGTARGGSGGLQTGRVKNVTHPRHGHLIPFENPAFCAQEACAFLAAEMAIWAAEERDYEEWTKLPVQQKVTLSREWKSRLKVKDRPKAKM
ncbi:hypothetical protein E4U43_001470 [Claviceps pusilla]|uniref:AB hydrolase-1 domain-containing protein n=1 Tax=Claviceps pusilla TaxID=123648 RepID=A0A9P7SZ38_9HYPO|nr:hypothetical protein E4U43_001470 [Claviceps pusilla]